MFCAPLLSTRSRVNALHKLRTAEEQYATATREAPTQTWIDFSSSSSRSDPNGRLPNKNHDCQPNLEAITLEFDCLDLWQASDSVFNTRFAKVLHHLLSRRLACLCTKVTPTKSEFLLNDCQARTARWCKHTHTHTFQWRQEFGDCSRMGNTPWWWWMMAERTKVRMYVCMCVRNRCVSTVIDFFARLFLKKMIS